LLEDSSAGAPLQICFYAQGSLEKETTFATATLAAPADFVFKVEI